MADYNEMNEIALILSAFENRLRAGCLTHHANKWLYNCCFSPKTTLIAGFKKITTPMLLLNE